MAASGNLQPADQRRRPAAADVSSSDAATGRELYLEHCAPCHGETGDGDTPVARYLHPRPRNFRAGRFRLVSTTNRVPTVEDLDAVLVRGMPGSVMPSWSHLPRQQRRLIIEEVQRLWRDGLRDQIVRDIQRDENVMERDIQPERIDQFVRLHSVPGAVTEVPDIGSPTEAAIRHGRQVYFRQSCHACHGNEGKGDGKKEMIDDAGRPTQPRDFTRGIFKGGDDPVSLYRRIAYGMPGTPMPSSIDTMPAEDIVDLVHYIRSLSTPSEREAAILRRERIIVQQVERLPDSADDPQWDTATPVRLRMTPMWWRHGADPDLHVQALHDGRSIAFRLRWHDQTEDLPAVAGGHGADGVALELFRGRREPFVGMGSLGADVEVWHWVAQPPTISPPVDAPGIDKSNKAAADAPPAERLAEPRNSEPDKLTLPAFPTDEEKRRQTHELGGLGGRAFRLPRSQLVKVDGRWKDDWWTVLMTRPLVADNVLFGVSLPSPCHASVAFAVWNASQGDRKSRKSITVWQDLVIAGAPDSGDPQ